MHRGRTRWGGGRGGRCRGGRRRGRRRGGVGRRRWRHWSHRAFVVVGPVAVVACRVEDEARHALERPSCSVIALEVRHAGDVAWVGVEAGLERRAEHLGLNGAVRRRR